MIPTVLAVALVALVALVAVGALVSGCLLAVAGVALLFRRTRAASPDPERIDEALLARLLVLRAFLVGRHAGGRLENKLRSVAVVRLEDPALPAANAPRDALLRGVFYALVLEELDRRTRQTSRRRPAKKLGARLGPDDPYPHYLRLVAATTREGEPGVTASRPWARNSDVIEDASAAAQALGLTSEEVDRYRRFLFQLPIQRWR